MEVVNGSHKMKIPIGNDNCIASDWTEKQHWTPVELEQGQLLIFGSYLAHRSGSNHSNKDRKALYATYNKASEGDYHGEYCGCSGRRNSVSNISYLIQMNIIAKERSSGRLPIFEVQARRSVEEHLYIVSSSLHNSQTSSVYRAHLRLLIANR